MLRQRNGACRTRRVPLAAPAPFLEPLDRLRAGARDYFGTDAVSFEPAAERRGRFGRVLRVGVETPGRRFAIFVKQFTAASDSPKDIARQHHCLATEFARTRQADAAFAATPDIGVARPIAMFEDILTLVTEEAPGVGLDMILKRIALRRTRGARDEAIVALKRLGRWLRIFQSQVAVDDPAFRKDYRRYLALRLRDLHRAGGIADPERDAAMAAYDRDAALVAPGDLVPVAAHADLCPPNILVAPDRVTVLDLAASVDRAKHMDVAFVYLHIALAGRRLLLGQSLVRELQDAFLRSYDPALERSAPAFRLMLLLQVIAHQSGLATMRRAGVAGAVAEWRLRRERPWALSLALSV